MFDRAHKFLSVVLLGVDTMMLSLAFGLAYIVRVQYDTRPLLEWVPRADYFWAIMMIIPMWLAMFVSLGLYRSRVYLHKIVEFAQICWGCSVGILFIIGLEYITNQSVFPARLVMVYALAFSIAFVAIGRLIAHILAKIWISKRWGATRILVIGDSEVSYGFIKQVALAKMNDIKILAYIGPKKYLPDNSKVKAYEKGEIKNLAEIIRKHRIGAIVQTGLENAKLNRQILMEADRAHVQYCFVPGEPELYTRSSHIGTFLDYPMVRVSQTPLVGFKLTLKRIFDLTLLLITMPVWGSILLVAVIGQKIFNPGKALFLQTRLGRYGKEFQIYKFRSMKQKYSGQDAVKIFKEMGREDLARQYVKDRKIEHDPRIAGWWGRLIRKTSIDELPQLLNVLRGEMSLVGPRPILPDELAFYSEQAPLLASVTPGLTGLASVSGRSDVPFERRVGLELYYASNWSFGLDIRILLQTAGVVLFGRGSK